MSEEVRVACRICGNERDNTRVRCREMMFGTREAFDYFPCGSCGCLQIERFPVDMSRYYRTEDLSCCTRGCDRHSSTALSWRISISNDIILPLSKALALRLGRIKT